MPAIAKPLSKTEVFVAALECANERPPDERLSEVMFGPFADMNAGWYWELKFTREFGITSSIRREGDTPGRRFRVITEQWVREVARYAYPDPPDDDDDDDDQREEIQS